MRIPWFWAALALVLGAECPAWLSLPGALAFVWLGRRRGWARAFVGLCVGALLTGLSAALATAAWLDARPATPATPLSGEVLFVDVGAESARVTVAPDAAPGHRVRITVPTRPPGLAPGARVLVTGALRRPDPADNPGTLDFAAWCARRRIAWVGHGGVEVLARAGPAAETVIAAREGARAVLSGAGPPEGAALLLGLLLGDQSQLPPWIARAFEATGTTHLLSVSGLHVSGVAVLVFALGHALGRRFGALRPEVPGALLALPASTLFVALAQFPVAGVRSGLMVVLALTAKLMARRADGRNVLGLTALVVLADDPGLVREPAFQLSFFAVLALILFAGEGQGLPGLLRASVVASLITFPVQCAHFGTVAPFSPLANLIVVPAASVVVVPLGLLGLVLHPIWPGLMPLAADTALGLACLTEILAEVGGGLWVPGAWAAVLVGVPGLCGMAHHWLGPRPALALGAVLLPFALSLRPPVTTLSALAVGQGDALLLRSGGRAMLIDTGPDPDATLLRATLRHAGVSRLDAVVITHAHPDHFGGLVALAGVVPIDALWTNGHLAVGEIGAPLARLLGPAGLVPTPPPAEVFRFGELWLRFFNLPGAWDHGESGAAPRANENDASLVLRVDGPGGAALLPGDIEAGAEGPVADAVAPLGPIDVLKAPHHGSRTSSTPRFLDRLRPRAVIFTTGRANQFRFPRPQIQARYAERGVAQWQTDTDGAVQVEFSEGGLKMSAYHRENTALLAPRGP